ncbi:MAG TPA: Xaa-Pro dipeptidyl-peptidase [Planctomycetota bacterium]
MIPQSTQANRVLVVTAFSLAGVLFAQEAKQETKVVPVFADGEAQVVDAWKKQADWIQQFLWVETTFDSDGDGKMDRMHVDVYRQKQTETEGLKVPVIYETSPYFAGTGSTDLSYFWDPKHEIGAEPAPRKPMPSIQYSEKPGMIPRTNMEVRGGDWLPRGYAVVHSSSPGTGFSQGCPTVGGKNESLAPKAVIDWLCGRAKGYTTPDGKEEVKATWCSGKVGMMGTSYNGTLPIAAATTGVEGLEAIVPIAPNTSYYLYYRSNGLVRHPGGYMGEDVDVLYDFINSGNPARRDWCNQQIRDGELKQGRDRLSGDYSDFWAGRDYLRQVGSVKAAVLMAHAWNDWNVMPEHSVRFYAECKRKGLPCMAFFHQGGHGGPPPRKLVNRWFTRFLHGVDNGVEKDPRAWIVRESSEDKRVTEPTPYADYPNPDASPVRLHLAAGGSSIGGLGTARVPDQKTEKIVDDVAVKGAQLAMAESSPHRLLYATPELQEPLHLSGTASLKIKLAASKPAANLSIWVVSLPWTDKGRITDNVITRGWADPQNHRSLTKGEPLVPGQFYELSFDLQPDDQIIKKGERIGLMIFSSDHDFTLWPAAGTELTIDLDYTSLELPVVGGAAAFAKATGATGAVR